MNAQRIPPEGHLGTETGVLGEHGEGQCVTDQAGTQPTPLQPSAALTRARTMIMLDSWTSGWLGGTRAMVTLAVTEMVVPEGLMVQCGGATTRSSSFSGESITAGLCGWSGREGQPRICSQVSPGGGGLQVCPLRAQRSNTEKV